MMSIRGFDRRSPVVRGVATVLCVLLVASGNPMLFAQTPTPQATPRRPPRVTRIREAHQRPARRAGRADRALSRPAAVAVAGRLHVPARTRAGAAVAREEQEAEGRRTDQGGREAEVGSQRAGHGRDSRSAEAPDRRHHLDAEPRQRVSRAAGRRDGRGAAAAGEGQGRTASSTPASSRRSRPKSSRTRPSSRSSPRAPRWSTSRRTARR